MFLPCLGDERMILAHILARIQTLFTLKFSCLMHVSNSYRCDRVVPDLGRIQAERARGQQLTAATSIHTPSNSPARHPRAYL